MRYFHLEFDVFFIPKIGRKYSHSTVASVLKGGFCVVIGCLGKLLGCFWVNFENTGRMEMFSMPAKSDLVESFIFG